MWKHVKCCRTSMIGSTNEKRTNLNVSILALITLSHHKPD